MEHLYLIKTNPHQNDLDLLPFPDLPHLKPALSRPHLTLKTRALAHRIVIENQTAKGVVFEHQGEIQTAYAAKEVLVCTGAIKTPQLLMLSGIGPRDQIEAQGLKVHQHLPGVGQNLQDHLCIPVVHECLKRVTFDRYQHPIRKFLVGLQWMVER